MLWGDKMKIENFLISGAPFGGPLAMIRDEKKVPSSVSSTSSATAAPSSSSSSSAAPSAASSGDDKSKLWIYTSAGVKLAEVDWESKKVAGMGWSDQELLVIVFEDGKLLGLGI